MSVGSFIWTHIRNLVEQPGASQEGQEVARLAAQVTLNNKFNTNGFQASRNYRMAQYSDAVSVSLMVTCLLIFYLCSASHNPILISFIYSPS